MNLACLTCAKAFQEAGGNAAGLSILFLLIIILAVLAVVAFSFCRIIKREKENLDPEFNDDYIPNTSTNQ